MPTTTPTPTPTSTSLSNGITVTKVIDGDTIEVQLDGITQRVRYIGIDTPESGDWLGEDAKKLNESLVLGKNVQLEKDISDKDSFGRLLRYVFVEGISVSSELLRAGLARANSYPPDIKDKSLHKQSETEAIGSIKGIWAVPQIAHVFFDGLVPRVESDEYVEIRNYTDKPFDMTGWKIKDRSGRHFFVFPNYVLNFGQTIRVYTNETHPEWGDLSFKSSTAIWNNDEDTAVLYDNQGMPVSRLRYKAQK